MAEILSPSVVESVSWDQAFLYYMFPILTGYNKFREFVYFPNVRRLGYSDEPINLKSIKGTAFFDFLLEQPTEDNNSNYGLPIYDYELSVVYDLGNDMEKKVKVPATCWFDDIRSKDGNVVLTNISDISITNTGKNSSEIKTNLQAKISFGFGDLGSLREKSEETSLTNGVKGTSDICLLDLLFRSSDPERKIKYVELGFYWDPPMFPKISTPGLKSEYYKLLKNQFENTKVIYKLQYVKHDMKYNPLISFQKIGDIMQLANSIDITYQVTAMTSQIDSTKYPDALLSTLLRKKIDGDKTSESAEAQEKRKKYEEAVQKFRDVCSTVSTDAQKEDAKEAVEDAKEELEKANEDNLNYYLNYFLTLPTYVYEMNDNFWEFKKNVLLGQAIEGGKWVHPKPLSYIDGALMTLDKVEATDRLKSGAWYKSLSFMIEAGVKGTCPFVFFGDIVNKIFADIPEETKILFQNFKLKHRWGGSSPDDEVNLLDYPISLLTWRTILDGILKAENLEKITKAEFFIKILNSKILSDCLDITNLIRQSDIDRYAIPYNKDNSFLDILQTSISGKISAGATTDLIIEYTTLQDALKNEDGDKDVQLNIVKIINNKVKTTEFKWSDDSIEHPLIFDKYTYPKYESYGNILKRHTRTGEPTFNLKAPQVKVEDTTIYSPIKNIEFSVIENQLLLTSNFANSVRDSDKKKQGAWILPHKVTITLPSEAALFLNPGDQIYIYDSDNHNKPEKLDYDFGYEGIYLISSTALNISQMKKSTKFARSFKRTATITATQVSFVDGVSLNMRPKPPSEGAGTSTSACADVASYEPAAEGGE